MFICLTRAPGKRDENDTDSPFLVNMALVKSIHRTEDYETQLNFVDGSRLIVQESVPDVLSLCQR